MVDLVATAWSTAAKKLTKEDADLEEGVVKTAKRVWQGWSNFGADPEDRHASPKDFRKQTAEFSDDELSFQHKHLPKNSRKHSPLDLQKKVVAREVKKRGLKGDTAFEAFRERLVK